MGKPAKTQEKRQKWEMLKTYCDDLQDEIQERQYSPSQRIAHNHNQIQLFESLGLRPPNSVRAFERFYENFIQKCSVLQPRRRDNGRRRGRERVPYSNGQTRPRHNEYKNNGSRAHNAQRTYVAVGSGVVHTGRTPYEVVPGFHHRGGRSPASQVVESNGENGHRSPQQASQVHVNSDWPGSPHVVSPHSARGKQQHLGPPSPSKHPHPSPVQRQNELNAKIQKSPLRLDQAAMMQQQHQAAMMQNGMPPLPPPITMHLNGGPMPLQNAGGGQPNTIPVLVQDPRGFQVAMQPQHMFQYGNPLTSEQFMYAVPHSQVQQSYNPNHIAHARAHAGNAYPIANCVCQYCTLLASRGIPSVAHSPQAAMKNQQSSPVALPPQPHPTGLAPQSSPGQQGMPHPPIHQSNGAFLVPPPQTQFINPQFLDPRALMLGTKISSRSILSTGSSNGPDPATVNFVPFNMHNLSHESVSPRRDEANDDVNVSPSLNANAKSYRPSPDTAHIIPSTNVQSLAHSRGNKAKRGPRSKRQMKRQDSNDKQLDHIQEDQSSRRSPLSNRSGSANGSHGSQKKRWQVKSDPQEEQPKPATGLTNARSPPHHPHVRNESGQLLMPQLPDIQVPPVPAPHETMDSKVADHTPSSHHSSSDFLSGSMSDELEEDMIPFTFVEDGDDSSCLSYPDIPDDKRRGKFLKGSKKRRRRKHPRRIKSEILKLRIKEEDSPTLSPPDPLEDLERDLHALQSYFTPSAENPESNGSKHGSEGSQEKSSLLSSPSPLRNGVSKSLPTVLFDDDDDDGVSNSSSHVIPDDVSESVRTDSSFDDREGKMDDVGSEDDNDGEKADFMNMDLDDLTNFLHNTTQGKSDVGQEETLHDPSSSIDAEPLRIVGILHHDSYQGNALTKILYRHENVEIIHLDYEFDANEFIRSIHQKRVRHLIVCEPDDVAAFGVRREEKDEDRMYDETETTYRDYVANVSNVLHMFDQTCPLVSVTLVARHEMPNGKSCLEGQNESHYDGTTGYRDFSLRYLADIGKYFCAKSAIEWNIAFLNTGFVVGNNGMSSSSEFALKSDSDSLEVSVTKMLSLAK